MATKKKVTASSKQAWKAPAAKKTSKQKLPTASQVAAAGSGTKSTTKSTTRKATTTSATAAPAKKAAATARTSRTAAKKDNGVLNPEKRYRMVEEAAYYIAEKSGFMGDQNVYWLEAEKKVHDMLAKKKPARVKVK